jgi:hypothetical protein
MERSTGEVVPLMLKEPIADESLLSSWKDDDE